MPTNWIAPDDGSIETVLSLAALKTADQKLTLTDDDLTRADKALTMEVNRIRAAIQLAGISPLSLTEGTVPPEAEKHTAVLAMQTLISSIPQLASYVVSAPGGGKTGLARMIEEAEAWLQKVTDGMPVVPPSDPCGQDYLTAVSTDNPAVSSIAWGDAYGTNVDYDNGFITAPDGSQIPLAPLNMNTQG